MDEEEVEQAGAEQRGGDGCVFARTQRDEGDSQQEKHGDIRGIEHIPQRPHQQRDHTARRDRPRQAREQAARLA